MISYDRTGSGPPLVLLHGLGSNRGIWEPVTGTLARERDVIAPDLPGFGASPPLAAIPTARALAVAVAGLLDDLGVARAHVAGNSLGGWVAVELAKLDRALSLTLLSPAGLWRRGAPRWSRYSLRANRALAGRIPAAERMLRSRAGRAVLLWQFFGRPDRVPPQDAIAATRSFATCPGFDPTFRALRDMRMTGARDLTVPVTVAFGSRDWLLLRGQTRHYAELPDSTRSAELPGCGHVPTWDDPQRVAHLILRAGEA